MLVYDVLHASVDDYSIYVASKWSDIVRRVQVYL